MLMRTSKGHDGHRFLTLAPYIQLFEAIYDFSLPVSNMTSIFTFLLGSSGLNTIIQAICNSSVLTWNVAKVVQDTAELGDDTGSPEWLSECRVVGGVGVASMELDDCSHIDVWCLPHNLGIVILTNRFNWCDSSWCTQSISLLFLAVAFIHSHSPLFYIGRSCVLLGSNNNLCMSIIFTTRK